MIVSTTPLSGLLTIEPIRFGDERGYFLETYHEERYCALGICDNFVQDNHSHSKKDVLRGMHFQIKNPQAQLVTVMSGTIFDVCVDMRKNSATFGQWYGVELSANGLRQIYMAPGFAHGFCVLSDTADLHYKVSEKYDGGDEGGLYWRDDAIGIKWPVQEPIVAERDEGYRKLSEFHPSDFPQI